MAEPDDGVVEALKAKHPEGEDPPAPARDPPPPLELSAEIVLGAVSRTPSGGAPGPDGLWPAHLKQMVGPSAGAARGELEGALVRFCGLCMDGSVPVAVRPLFFGAGNVAFRKKDGGLRPIAVGLLLRRLVSKAACTAVQEEAAALLAPVQLGIGVPGGSEAAVHGVRRFLEGASSGSGLVKLNLTNAFNTVSRAAVVSSVSQYMPGLERLIRCAYGARPYLLYAGRVIVSSSGVQSKAIRWARCCSRWPFEESLTAASLGSRCGISTTGHWVARPTP